MTTMHGKGKQGCQVVARENHRWECRRQSLQNEEPKWFVEGLLVVGYSDPETSRYSLSNNRRRSETLGIPSVTSSA